MELPIRETTDIEIDSKYKYYGNTSWRKNNCPVTGTIESKSCKGCTIEDYKFSTLIRLSKPPMKGDSGAILLSQDDHAIGIVIARFEDEEDADNQYGFAIPIQDILNNLEVNFILF